jgi:hypothetical protein
MAAPEGLTAIGHYDLAKAARRCRPDLARRFPVSRSPDELQLCWF